MNVLKKRIIPGVMAGALALVMAVPAFAGNATPSNTNTDISGQYVAATIAVTVPETGTAFINPYALPVALNDLSSANDSENAAATDKILNQQIVTEPLFISNESEVDLAVSATVTGTIPAADASAGTAASGVKFGTAAPGSSDTSKTVFTYLQMQVEPTLTGASTSANRIAAFANWTDDSYNKNKDLVVGTKAAEKENIVVLKSAYDATTGAVSTTGAMAGGVAMFRLAGQVVTDPKTPWTADDTFKVHIAFTFKPDVTTANISATSDTLDASSGNITLTASLKGAKISSVTWDVDNNTLATLSATTGTSITVSRGTGTGTVVVTATIKADNGATYSKTQSITVN